MLLEDEATADDDDELADDELVAPPEPAPELVVVVVVWSLPVGSEAQPKDAPKAVSAAVAKAAERMSMSLFKNPPRVGLGPSRE